MPRGNPYETKARKIVTNVLEDALAVTHESIGPRNTLYGTMGMESIDILDINFKLEGATGINGLDPFGQRVNLSTDQETHRYTPESMQRIRDQMPHFYNAMSPRDREEFDREGKPTQFQNAWNVDGLVQYVAEALKQQAEQSKATKASHAS
jgi:acyl carrier protein